MHSFVFAKKNDFLNVNHSKHHLKLSYTMPSVYLKKINKTVPLASVTSCNVYHNYTGRDGTFTSCKQHRMEGETVCKQHFAMLEQRIHDLKDDLPRNSICYHEKNTIKIDYRNHLVVYFDNIRKYIYTFRFANDSTCYCLQPLNVYKQENDSLDSILSPAIGVFSDTYVISSGIVATFPAILDFMENETREILNSIYNPDISDIILEYVDIRKTKINVINKRYEQFSRNFSYSTKEEKINLFRFQFKQMFPWSEVFVHSSTVLNLLYSIVVGMVLVKLPERLDIKHYAVVLRRLENLKAQSYKRGYCKTPEIEFVSLQGLEIEPSALENAFQTYMKTLEM